jgi:hypothetical protein
MWIWLPGGYMSQRKHIPENIRRAIYIEAGYRCAVPRCQHEIGLEIHHIDGNRNNVNQENLLLLCAVHHRLATNGKMDRKTCRRLKKLLSIEHRILRLPSKMIFHYSTRKKFNDAIIGAVEAHPKLLRAIIVGPHFLHPHWVMKRRLQRESRKSFSLALRTYIEKSVHECDRDIRLILRNSIRYPEILKTLMSRNEVAVIIQEMKSTLHRNFSGSGSPCVSFCCVDPGYYYGVLITEKSCFITTRKTALSQIEYGYELKDPCFIEMELVRFDRVFDANFKGLDVEMELLERYITTLEHLI